MKQNDPNTPYSIDRAALILQVDRRTLAAALFESERLDHIFPCDHLGTRKSPRYTLRDCCEAYEFFRVRSAPTDTRIPCEAYCRDMDKARSLDCPRCGQKHVELPVMPLRGKKDSPQIMAFYEKHGFKIDYGNGHHRE